MFDFPLEPIFYLIFFVTAIVAGFLNVMAGGGSLLTVPLMLFCGIDAPVANGTNRIALLAQNISSTLTFIKRGYKDIYLSITLSLCALPGAIYGAYLGVNFGGIWFNRTIAIIMIVVMIITLYQPKKKKQSANQTEKTNYKNSRWRLVLGHFLMIGLGFYGGIIQMGVGFLFPLVLNKVMGIDFVRSNMYKVFIIGSYTLVALIIYSTNLSILWGLGIILACGNSLGGYIGTRTSIAKGEKFIIWILNFTLTIFIIKLLFN